MIQQSSTENTPSSIGSGFSIVKPKQVINIGFLDSGVGGLMFLANAVKHLHSRLEELQQKYDLEINLIHIGDSKNAPYGEKQEPQIKRFTTNIITNAIEEHKCDIVMLACNTASVVYGRQLEEEFKRKYPEQVIIPIIKDSAEYVLKRAEDNNETGNPTKIAIFCTPFTHNSGQYVDSVKAAYENMPKAQNQSSQLEVVTFPMPNWVTMIEQNVPNHVLFKQVRKDIKEFTNKHGTEFDAIFLGCTHYPFLKKLIRQEMKACGAKSPEIYSQGKLFAHIISEKLDNLITAKAPDERRAGQESDQEIKLYSYYTGEISPKEIATKIRTGVDNEAMPGFAIKGIKVLSNDEIVKMMETAIYEQVPDLGTIHTRAGGIAARA